jgi:hypothetical protein
MDGRTNISNDLFYKVRSRFSGLKLGTETGEITINPEEARFFDFDYKDNDQAMGHVTISLAEPNSMKVYFSSGITESMEGPQKTKWYSFLKELREFAKRRLMAFDTRDISKDNLDRRDFQFLTTISQPKAATDTILTPVGESVMNESQLYGTNKISYQKLMDTRLIIKHSKALTDDQQPGARSRNISALFVENQEGERFKYPFIHLAGARAMQRHVANSGLPYDDVGKSIISMSEQIAQLKSFSNYVVRNDLMNSDNNSIIERSVDALTSLREQINKLSKQGYYEQYKENFQQRDPVEIPQSVVEEFTDKFTVKSFKEEISSVFPLLYKIMKEKENVDYDDIVSMTTQESYNDEAEVDIVEDEFDQYEQWILDLGESSPIQSNEEQLTAIEGLNKMISQVFPVGVDGTNAIQSLKGIIEDPKLFKEIKDAARQNPQEDVRPMIKAWVESNAQEIAAQLDFGDMEQTSQEPEIATTDTGTDETGTDDAMASANAAVADATGQEEVVTQSDDNVSRGQSKKINVTELAEFISSFYDKNSGTFPKGPEGVCTMVGKKFGEQAETVARKFVERMAPQQSTEQNPELAELARIRELSGLQSSEMVTQEAADNYMWQEVGDEQDQRQLQRMVETIYKLYQHGGEVKASKEEIFARLDEIVREFVPQVGKMTNVAPVSQAFFDKFPLKKPEAEYDDDGEEIENEEYESLRDRIHDTIWSTVKIAAASEKGDTSMFGYKVHPSKEDVNPELKDIQRLSGISQQQAVEEDPASRYQANKGYSMPGGEVSPEAEAVLKMLAAKDDWQELGKYYDGKVSGSDHEEAAEYIRKLWDEISYDMGSAGEDPDNTGPEIVQALQSKFGTTEEIAPELEDIRRLSGITQGIMR